MKLKNLPEMAKMNKENGTFFVLCEKEDRWLMPSARNCPSCGWVSPSCKGTWGTSLPTDHVGRLVVSVGTTKLEKQFGSQYPDTPKWVQEARDWLGREWSSKDIMSLEAGIIQPDGTLSPVSATWEELRQLLMEMEETFFCISCDAEG